MPTGVYVRTELIRKSLKYGARKRHNNHGICLNCSDLFEVDKTNRKYCPKCKKHCCNYCGKEILRRYKFCSKSCVVRYYRKGKTYEEIHGIEKAIARKRSASAKIIALWSDPNSVYNSKDFSLKHSNSLKAKYQIDPEFRHSVGNANRGKSPSAERRNKIGDSNRRHYEQHPERRINLSQKQKINFSNPVLLSKVFCRREKSEPETIFQNIVDENNLPWYFNGSLNNKIPLVVGTKVPDFVHNFENKVIEIWGDYFHKGQNPQDRINYFIERNYECLIFWASELKNREDILNKTICFGDM